MAPVENLSMLTSLKNPFFRALNPQRIETLSGNRKPPIVEYV
jgi:hypothetical protein